VNLRNLPWKKSVAVLGMGFWASSLALLSPTAQSQSNDVPYCFGIKTAVDVYEGPSFGSRKVAAYITNDTAYATTTNPTQVWVNDGTTDGNNFVEVAFTGGQTGWVPRYRAGSDTPAMVDMSGFTDCPDPGPGAAGYATGPTPAVCFFVQRPTNVYSRPAYGAITPDSFAVGDTAYATTAPPTSVWLNDPDLVNGNSFIEVEIYGGNTAWVPRFRADADAPLLVDLAECP